MIQGPHEIVKKTDEMAQEWAPKTDAEVGVSNAAYEATVMYFEALEHTGRHKGNGHQLAQRVAALVALKLQGSAAKDTQTPMQGPCLYRREAENGRAAFLGSCTALQGLGEAPSRAHKTCYNDTAGEADCALRRARWIADLLLDTGKEPDPDGEEDDRPTGG